MLMEMFVLLSSNRLCKKEITEGKAAVSVYGEAVWCPVMYRHRIQVESLLSVSRIHNGPEQKIVT